MKTRSIIVWIYALIILFGGIMGHIKAQSKASLWMGIISAVLLAASGALMYLGKKIGYHASLTLVCLLTIFFAWRFGVTLKFMPAGLMLIVSVVVGLALLKKQRA